MTDYTRYRSGEWSALYEDGNLVMVGDHYRTDEYLEDVLGVNVIYNDDFLTQDRHGALPTLKDVEAHTDEREERQIEIQQMRAQAQALLHDAEELEKML